MTVDAVLFCLDMDWTGSLYIPTLAIITSSSLLYYGSATFIANMVFTGAGTGALLKDGNGNGTLTTNGLSIGSKVGMNTTNTGTLTLADDLTITKNIASAFQPLGGTLNTANKTINITAGGFYITGTSTRVISLGSSTINCTSFDATTTTNLTLTANTSTIKVTGTGAFTGAGITTYNNVELNGTAHTISGSNTFNRLSFNPAGNQAITFTDGTTQTYRELARNNKIGVITFQGSGAAGYNLVGRGNWNQLAYMSISRCTATPANMHFAEQSTNGGNNSGWGFFHKVRYGMFRHGGHW